jgi:hypothetical protein
MRLLSTFCGVTEPKGSAHINGGPASLDEERTRVFEDEGYLHCS